MMQGASIFEMMKDLTQKGLSSQIVREGDRLDENGFLICGKCGEYRQRMMLFNDPTDEDPNHQSPLKVSCECRCDRERALAEKEKARKEEEERIIKRLRKASMIDDRFSDASFSKFEVTKYNERNLKICRRYAEKFDLMMEKNQGLLMWGDVGTGKTFAAACIANALLAKKIPVMMTSFVKLLAIIQSGEEKDQDVIYRLGKAKLVIFDDLGAERGTDYALEKVYSIVDGRYRQKLPCIYTTNQTLADMDSETDVRYSRIYDRILSNSYPLQFVGKSWRKKEAGRRYAEMERLLDD